MKTLKTLSLVILAGALLYQCSKDGGNSETFSGTGLSGSTARFAINGDYLYTVDNSNLHVFSIANGAHPVRGGAFRLGENDIETIFSLGSNLFIGAQSGVHIVNISNPTYPFISSQIQHLTSCDPVVAEGPYAYLTISNGRPRCFVGGGNQLQIYNISNIYSPYQINSIGMTQPNGLALDGKWLFVCDNGLKMYDRTNPENLVQKQFIPGSNTYDCIAANKLLTVSEGSGISQYSYANDSLKFLSKIPKALPSL